MKTSDCWQAASAKINTGDIDGAIAICKEDPCSDCVKCQSYLGWVYANKNDLEKAEYWWLKAASSGDGNSCFNLAKIFRTQNDHVQAFHYFDLAARYGCTRAYYWIGHSYHFGTGVRADITKAAENYKKGAERGYLIAEKALAHIKMHHGSWKEKIIGSCQSCCLLFKAFRLALKNPKDERLIDIPDVFQKPSSSRFRSERSPDQM
jgi:TPR repeat protein